MNQLTSQQFTPESVEELQRWLQSRHEQGGPFSWSTGVGSIAADQAELSLIRLQNVVDYPHRDMTITVQAGMTVAALQQILAEQRQWLPVNVPAPETTTLAELIVEHWFGSFVAGYGTVRDWLLGIAAVDGTGRLFHAGGRVVKNVAGYDLCKLLVGSQGQLAIPVEVTLQARPLPESVLVGKFSASTPVDLKTAWDIVRNLPMKPVVLDLTSQNWGLLVAVEGTASSTRPLMETIEQSLAVSPGIQHETTTDWSNEFDPWQKLSASLEGFSSSRLLRVGVLPSQTVSVLELAEAMNWQAVGFSTRGTVIMGKPESEVSAFEWEKLGQGLAYLNANIQVLAGPAELRQQNIAQQQQLSAWPLMQKLKGEFDPSGVFGFQA